MAAVLAWAAEGPGTMAQGPQPPATFYGSLTVDGGTPPAGTDVRAFVGGRDCTQEGSERVVDADGAVRYVVDVMHATQSAGCGTDGATVTFTIDGRAAEQVATWRSGAPQQLDLSVGEAAARATASPSAAGAATVTVDASAVGSATESARPGATLPVPLTVRGSPPAVPVPAQAGDGALWPWIAGGAGLAAALGAAGWLAARRLRRGRK